MEISVTNNSDRLFITAGNNSSPIDQQGISKSSLFQRIFGYATTITINGQKYSVNTNSLKKFLVRISTKDANLIRSASKDAPETDQNKKIRDIAFNALTKTATTKEQDFSTVLKNQILQLHRSTFHLSQSDSIPFVTFKDALNEEKWNELFEKIIDTQALPPLDLNGTQTQTSEFIEISAIDVTSDAERQEREELLSQFKTALKGFHLSLVNGVIFGDQAIQTIMAKSTKLPIETLKKNTEIATKLAAMVQSEKKCDALKAQKKRLEDLIESTHASIQRADAQIAQLTTLNPYAQVILKKLDGKTLITDDELSYFSSIPELQSQLSVYNHSINEINRLNQEFSSFDSVEQANYLAALTGHDTDLTALNKEIEKAHNRLIELQSELELKSNFFETHNTEKRRIETITQHLTLIEQLLLSSPFSSKVDQLTAKAKRAASRLALLSSNEVEAKKAELAGYIEEHKRNRDNESNSTAKRSVAQEMLTRTEQTLSYYNLFGDRKALTQTEFALKQELNSLKKAVSQSEKSQKSQALSRAAEIKTEITQLYQSIKTNEAAFWQIVDTAEKSTARKKAENIWSKFKALSTKKADLSGKAVTNTAQFLATLHAEIGKCQLEIKHLITNSQRISQEILHHQTTMQTQVSQLKTSLNFTPTLFGLNAQSKTQSLAYHQANDKLYEVTEQIKQAERLATEVFLAYIPEHHSFSHINDACLINASYLLSTGANDSFRSSLENALKTLRHTTSAIDFSSYENLLLFDGAKEWLTA